MVHVLLMCVSRQETEKQEKQQCEWIFPLVHLPLSWYENNPSRLKYKNPKFEEDTQFETHMGHEYIFQHLCVRCCFFNTIVSVKHLINHSTQSFSLSLLKTSGGNYQEVTYIKWLANIHQFLLWLSWWSSRFNLAFQVARYKEITTDRESEIYGKIGMTITYHFPAPSAITSEVDRILSKLENTGGSSSLRIPCFFKKNAYHAFHFYIPDLISPCNHSVIEMLLSPCCEEIQNKVFILHSWNIWEL